MRTSRHGAVDGEPTTCRDCPATIVWVKTRTGSKMPVNVGDDTSHFSNCPAADKRRRARAAAGNVPEGFGPVITGEVLRFCELEDGAVVLARGEDDAILRELKGHVVVVMLDDWKKLKAGERVKLRRLPK